MFLCWKFHFLGTFVILFFLKGSFIPGGKQTLVILSWSYQNWLGLSLDFLGPIGFVAATWQANWPPAALVKRDINPAKTAL